MWPKDQRIAAHFQLAARDWHNAANGASWNWRVTGFTGYFWQWKHFQENAADAAANARQIMGTSDETL